MPLVVITDPDQFKALLKDEKKPLTIVNFTATWCSSCKTIKPYFQELAGTFSDKANFCQIDVDDNEDLVMELNVSGTPSFQAFFNGERKEQVANGTKESLKALVDKVVKL